MPDGNPSDPTEASLITVEGEILRLLPDDQAGSRHQRFVIRLSSGRTLLVSHNLDLSDRVPIEAGDRVRVRGDFEWSAAGGTIHWTHLDPRNTREGGWIIHKDVRYQ
jgi:hypothetical protein